MAEEATTEENFEAKDLATYIEELAGSNRRARQEAAHAIAKLSKDEPEALEADIQTTTDALIDALFKPEAQTRWEALDALSNICLSHPELVKGAYEGAEASLFDDNNSRVRIAAFRFLCRLSASNSKQSDKIWPILDEAIQCYHGDQGYRDMLGTMLELAQGKASKATKAALAERLRFDSENGRGYVQSMSAEIVAAAQ